MKSQNYLLGKGERLTETIVVKSGGGPKNHPYTIGEARHRIIPMVTKVVNKINSLPEVALP